VPDGTEVITASISDAGRDWFGNYDLGLYFILDADRRLDRVFFHSVNNNSP
jgi:hypothetical protein